MINDASEKEILLQLNRFIASKNVDRLQNHNQLNGYTVDKFTLDDDDFQTIKIQLRALGLIAKSSKARSVKDQETYWTLTPYGDEVMIRLRAVRRDVVEERLGGDIEESEEQAGS